MTIHVQITDAKTGEQKNEAIVTFMTIGDKSAASVAFLQPHTPDQEELVEELIPVIVRDLLGLNLTQENAMHVSNDRDAGELQRKWFGGGKG